MEEKKKDKSEMSKFKQALERLRKKKYDMEESIVPPAEDFDYVAEGECTEGDCGKMEEGNAFLKKLKDNNYLWISSNDYKELVELITMYFDNMPIN